jgi:hypothetical protein
MAPRRRSLCVYCGARTGTDPAHAAAARELGRLIGERGWRLVYGGGNVGLMGEVADAALAAGAAVLGIIPDSLMRREVGHPGLTELQVVATMHERKQRMAEQADAFVALPGGIGTLEELFEVWTWRHLGYHDKPVALLDVGGFWQPLRAFMQSTQVAGFVDAGQMAMLQTHEEPAALMTALAQALDARDSLPGQADYGRI